MDSIQAGQKYRIPTQYNTSRSQAGAAPCIFFADLSRPNLMRQLSQVYDVAHEVRQRALSSSYDPLKTLHMCTIASIIRQCDIKLNYRSMNKIFLKLIYRKARHNYK